ncbi:MAG: hypothetical protein A2V78_13715 [Betaproteobacteria bacterium RBG_16_64_18]|nr:MAG: hypothetical protein A2V78_13715 [Betaproteobacteria bacterium RBG_16_64_18]
MTLLLRFVALDARPVMHDESLFAFDAFVYFERGSYTHLPILHGPTLILAVGKLFAVFGDSIVVARAFIAAASLVMLAATLALVPHRYRLWFAPLLITSPVLLYYSRFLRDDILFGAVLMLGMAMFVALAGIMENVVFIYATGATFLLLLAVKRYLWDGWRRHRNVDPRAGPGSGDGIGDAVVGRDPGSGRAIANRRERCIVGAGWTAGLLLGLAYLAFVYGITLGPSYQDAARLAVAGDAPEIRRAIFLNKLELT